jgi:type II secretory pathway component PulC
MKQLLWIINSALLFLLIAVLGFMFFTQEHIPYREDIEPAAYVQPVKEVISKVNIEKIWQNDLFNTYKREVPTPEGLPPEIQLPPPPEPQTIAIPEPPKPEFLEPLNVTLKGIIVLVNDDTKNRAIIADNKTERECLYRVGDMIEDAQLIRIFNNKIILMRSNGQQEVLYLREKDAKMDPAYAIIGNWDEVVQKVAENNYLISPNEFTHRITNLAQFIDMLDLTTLYREGKSVGIRVGQIVPDSIGALLGLQKNDVIIAVNDISTADNNSRYEIYQKVTSLGEDDIITVVLRRNDQEITLTYTLQDFKGPEGATPEPAAPVAGNALTPPTAPKVPTIPLRTIEKQQEKVLQERHRFAPTVKDIRTRERQNMMKRGKLPQKQEKFRLTE